MPLDKSGSKASVGNNIRTELKAHPSMPQKQAVAIALDVARRSKRAAGGSTTQQPWFVRHEAERELRPPSMPKLATTPPAIPLVKGNLAASTPLGQALGSSPKVGVPKTQFPKLPTAPKLPGSLKMPKTGLKSGGEVLKGPVIGSSMGRADQVNGSVPNNSFIVPAHVVSALGQGNTLAGQTVLNKMFPASKTSAKAGGHVKVALSDGEFQIDPEHVQKIGKGDYERGHKILKNFCLHVKHKLIENLKHLPDPVDNGDE